jgi:hypothetical protein
MQRLEIILNKLTHLLDSVEDSEIKNLCHKYVWQYLQPQGLEVYRLTFPTELAFKKGKIDRHFPIIDRDGNSYVDAEQAYQINRVLAHNDERLSLYVRIAVTKFMQYPDLVDGIMARGGIRWLETCEHNTNARSKRFQWWQGVGRESVFICCLIRAFERVVDFPLSYSAILDQPKQLKILGLSHSDDRE